MVDIGLVAYRFSISWSRLIPRRTSQHLLMRASRNLGTVLHWTTMNEANILALGGYDNGLIPPNRCSAPFRSNCTGGNSSTEVYIVGHNMLLAHSSAVRLYKRKYKGFVGISVYGSAYLPYINSEADVMAVQLALDFYIGWFIEPLIFGDYPQIMKKNVGSRLPRFSKNESELVKGSLDFIGLNHYNQVYAKDNPSSLEEDLRDFTMDTRVETLRMNLQYLPTEGYQLNEPPPGEMSSEQTF